MRIDVILYGKLGKKVEGYDDTLGSLAKIELELEKELQIAQVMKRLDIREEEVSHIFLNREYSHPERVVEDGDRLALFPKDMALLYKWYFSKKR